MPTLLVARMIDLIIALKQRIGKRNFPKRRNTALSLALLGNKCYNNKIGVLCPAFFLKDQYVSPAFLANYPL